MSPLSIIPSPYEIYIHSYIIIEKRYLQNFLYINPHFEHEWKRLEVKNIILTLACKTKYYNYSLMWNDYVCVIGFYMVFKCSAIKKIGKLGLWTVITI